MTPAPPALEHRYLFGPFLITSTLQILELAGSTLPAATVPGSRSVSLTLGPTPTSLHNAQHYGSLCQVTSNEYLLEIPEIARFHVAHGREVRVTLHPGAPLADVTAYLLGSVFGALCHQNALLPLHASAVATPAGVVAFLGQSGAGKSTLAATLQHRGHTIVSDDICLVEPPIPPAADPSHVIPVAGWLKLWRSSFDHLGQVPDERNRVFAANDKFRVYLKPTPAPAAHPLTLRNLIFLERATDPASSPRLEPMSTAEAIAQMIRLTYLSYITELTQTHARAFTQCAAVLAHARPYRLVVPWELTRLDASLALLDRTIFAQSINN